MNIVVVNYLRIQYSAVQSITVSVSIRVGILSSVQPIIVAVSIRVGILSSAQPITVAVSIRVRILSRCRSVDHVVLKGRSINVFRHGHR